MMIAAASIGRRAGQRGVALYVVLMFVLLSMLLVLWASRTALFSEMVVGNDADYQRAFEAAQALLQDAELDIRAETATGGRCMRGGQPCRQGKQSVPDEDRDIAGWLTVLQNDAATGCKDGLCVRRVGRQDFWNNTGDVAQEPGEVTLAAMTAAGVGARYGDYTRAGIGSAAKPINPILANHKSGEGGWYWIEVLDYRKNGVNAGVVDFDSSAPPILALNIKPHMVYRITALAYGRKPGTRVVLQETYVRQKRAD
jgi:type IV pilus assembly protein PilX